MRRGSKRSRLPRPISSQLRKRTKELPLPVKQSAQPMLLRKLWVISRQPPARSLSIVPRTSPALESLIRSLLMLTQSSSKLLSLRALDLPRQAHPHLHPQLARAPARAPQEAAQLKAAPPPPPPPHQAESFTLERTSRDRVKPSRLLKYC